MTAFLVALAGGLGAVARFVADWLVGRARSAPPFTGTFLVNVVGSCALGLAYGSGHLVQAVVGAGFLGGFTTFSAASLEVVRLAQGHAGPGRWGDGRWGRLVVRASAHALLMVCTCVAAAALGLWLAGA
jgi:CrcB protein